MANDTKIAGKRTVNDWLKFRKTLMPGGDPKLWETAFRTYFEVRLSTRYLKPIESLQASQALNGEGFSILAIHCSMIEFLESTLQGKTYRFRRKSDSKLQKHEYFESGKMFSEFLSKRQPFCGTFDKALADDFYAGVRCALLHEARTKGGWIVKAKGADITIVSGGQIPGGAYRFTSAIGLEAPPRCHLLVESLLGFFIPRALPDARTSAILL